LCSREEGGNGMQHRSGLSLGDAIHMPMAKHDSCHGPPTAGCVLGMTVWHPGQGCAGEKNAQDG